MPEPQLEFDHVGVPTDEEQEGESWVEATRVWVTNPRAHKYHIEFLRFAPDSPSPGITKTLPHVAYRVPTGTLDQAVAAEEVVIAPFEAQAGHLRVAFVKKHQGLVEYMEFTGDPEKWFPPE